MSDLILYMPRDGYSTLASVRPAFSAFTLAAAVATGLVSVDRRGNVKRGKSHGRRAFVRAWRDLVGQTAWRYWRGRHWVANDGFTDAGIARLRDRLSAVESYSTDAATYRALLRAVRTGGAVKLPNGRQVQFTEARAIIADADC